MRLRPQIGYLAPWSWTCRWHTWDARVPTDLKLFRVTCFKNKKRVTSLRWCFTYCRRPVRVTLCRRERERDTHTQKCLGESLGVCVREREMSENLKREREFCGRESSVVQATSPVVTFGQRPRAQRDRARARARVHACSRAGIPRERLGGRGWKQTRIVQFIGTKK